MRSYLVHVAAGALAAGFLVSGAPARADIAPSPPNDCPAGSTGATTKSNGFCTPTECKADADCPPKTDVQYSISTREQTVTYGCENAGLCVQEKVLTEYTKVWPPPAGQSMRVTEKKTKRDVAVGKCTEDRDCSAGVKCTTRARCLEVTRTYKDDGAPVPFFKPQAAGRAAKQPVAAEPMGATPAGAEPAAPVASAARPALPDTPRAAARCGCIVGMESTAPLPWPAAFFALALVCVRARRVARGR